MIAAIIACMLFVSANDIKKCVRRLGFLPFQTSYQFLGTNQAGARLAIHDPGVAAMPSEFGFDVEPNTLASVAMQEVRQPYYTVTIQ